MSWVTFAAEEREEKKLVLHVSSCRESIRVEREVEMIIEIYAITA